MRCNICPRHCNIDRASAMGYCGATDRIKINKVMLHHYEEPIISGVECGSGSGAIFFAGCNLKCCYCQNYLISHGNNGKFYTINDLVQIIRDLEALGAYNINFVTPTHYTREIIEALRMYKPKIPIVWNSSGYESVETIRELRDYVDIYLVDIKYSSNQLAMTYSKASDYVEINRECILEMRCNQPQDIIVDGLIKRGVIVRHLVLPSHTSDSIKCLDFICDNLGVDTIISIMSQYQPLYEAESHPEINRKITPLEYKRVISHAISRGMTNAYTQDLASADSQYIPDFESEDE